MIALIREAMEGPLDLDTDTVTARYQKAFDVLTARCGQDEVNRVIRRAVLGALRTALPAPDRVAAENGEPQICAALEKNTLCWEINSTVESLGTILSEYGTPFGEILLTSNFDPLIEVSLSRACSPYFVSTPHADASPSLARGQGCHVVHFHGYWSQSDTLHTPSQLQHPRPQLESWLTSVLRQSTVVVVAYGGWDDVFTRALARVAEDPMAFPDVLWTFRETGADEIRKRFSDRVEALVRDVQPGRIQLYGGVDVRTFFPSLLGALHRDAPRIQEGPAGSRISQRHLEIPPDDRLTTRSPLQGLPALPLEDHDLRSLPLDIGTAWGLDRGVIFGLLGGWPEDQAFDVLLSSEAALWRARRETRECIDLPIRWWLRIIPDPSNAPETVAQVWSAARERSNPRIAHLRDYGISDGLVLGVFLDSRAEEGDPVAVLSAWLSQLARLFADRPPAILIHIGGVEAVRLSAIARQLGRSRYGDLAPEVLWLLRRPPQPVIPASRDKVPVLLAQLAERIGGELRDWLQADGGLRVTGPGDLREARLVGQLDALSERLPSAEPDRTLLEWSARQFPERVDVLLRMYARSSRKRARQESLNIAAQTDEWMDAWVSGADLADASLLELVAVAHPNGSAIADEFALALMRSSGRGRDSRACDALIETLSHRLSPELRAVDALRRAETKERLEHFLESQGPVGYGLAMRAAIQLWPSRAFLQRLDIERVDLWRLLTALPVARERVSDLLALNDPACRAVFGLCTANEWAAVRRDPVLERLVLDARRDRPLALSGEA